MRLAVILSALLAVAATPRGGCGPSPSPTPSPATGRASGSCDGKTCGETCSLCGDVPCMSPVATACDRAGACVPATPWLCYDPCAGKTCGDACALCPPDQPDCVSILCVTSCDAAGRCVCAGSAAACP